MKNIYVMRHGKSSWADPDLEDFDRPLNARGSKAGARMGVYMHQAGFALDLVLCSAAKRARETLKCLGDAIPPTTDVCIENALYSADADGLLHRIRRIDDGVRRVLVIGHNTAIEDFSLSLVASHPKSEDRKTYLTMKRKFPTAALAVFSVKIDAWQDLNAGSGVLERFLRPKSLPLI